MDDEKIIDFVKTQLTVARWFLDAAAASTGEVMQGHLHQARRAYESIRQMLPHISVEGEREARLSDEVSALVSQIALIAECSQA